jgi:hypothetical protein
MRPTSEAGLTAWSTRQEGSDQHQISPMDHHDADLQRSQRRHRIGRRRLARTAAPSSFTSLFRSAAMIALLHMTNPCPSRAFQASVTPITQSRRISSSALGSGSSSNQNGGGPSSSSQKRIPKKPRFSQSAATSAAGGTTGPAPPRPRQVAKEPPRQTIRESPLPSQRTSAANAAAVPARPPAAAAPSMTTTTTTRRNGNYDDDYSAAAAPFRPPVRSSKSSSSSTVVNKERMWKDRPQSSINDLEDRLSKRWGTDMRQWTASDDFDDTDEDDDEEDNGAGPNSQYNGVDNKASTSASTSASSFPARPVKDPWLAAPPAALSDTSLPRSVLGAFAKAPASDRSPLAAFGGGPAKPKPAMDLSHLIADTPAAGGSSSTSSSEPKLKKKRVVEKLPIPLTRNGEPLYLTCEQAARLFQERPVTATTTTNNNRPRLAEDDTPSTDEKPPPSSSPPPLNWSELGITSPRLLENLRTMGCERPLASQRNSCVSILAGKDAVVGTYTGSGT